MKKRRYAFWEFKVYETEALAEYLEDREQHGWILSDISGSGFLKFERGEPARCRYCAAVLPGSSELDGARREEAVRFRELCEEAGWELQHAGHVWQIYKTRQEDLVPIETDPQLKLEAIGSYLFSPFRLVAAGVLFLILLIPVFLFLRDPVWFLASKSQLLAMAVLILGGVWLPGMVLGDLFWYRRERRKILQGGTESRLGFARVKRRTCRDVAVLILALTVLTTRSGRGATYLLGFLGSFLGILICGRILALIREHSVAGRGAKAALYIFTAFLAVTFFNVLYGGVMGRFLGSSGRETVFASYEDSGFPDVLGAAGADTGQLMLVEDEKTPLASRQRVYGYCVLPSGERSHAALTHCTSLFPAAIEGTLKRQYPADHGNAWTIEETERTSRDGWTFAKYEYRLPEDRQERSLAGRVLYLAFSDREILSLDLGSAGDERIFSELQAYVEAAGR